MALLLVMAISVAAMAAGPGPQNPDAGTGINAGLYGTFVDANGDGVCDTYADRVPARDGTGSRWGAQNGGVPAQDGTGSQMRRGGRTW